VGATIRATSTVTLLSIALWALNHDDEEYRELPQWEKDTYWHIKRRDGTGFIKIPKPQGPLGAVFGNTFEKALDTISETDPHAWKRLFVDDPASDAIASDTAKSQARGVLETIIPTGLLPIVESLTNYDLFRRKSIVSDYDTGLPAELQYNRWTSETAKILGRRLGLPPAMIDHVITGYGAGLAKEAITATDTALGFLETGPKKPTMGPARWSGVSAFYRNLAGSDAESMQELYRRRDALRDVPRTIRLYEAEGRPEQAAAHKAKFPDRDRQAKILNRAANDIGDLRDVIAKVYAHPTLTPDEKREMLDRTYERMVNIARQALGKPALASRFDAPVSADLMRTFEATPTSQPARR
jgi:hypothetical protein